MKKQVRCIETNQIFESAKQASEILHIDRTKICKCCNKKLKSASKLHFEFFQSANLKMKDSEKYRKICDKIEAFIKAHSSKVDNDIINKYKNYQKLWLCAYLKENNLN